MPAVARVSFMVAGRVVGSVAVAHLAALRAWPDWLTISEQCVALIAAERTAALAEMHAALRAQGLILAWRDEIFPLFDPHTFEVLATMERAAARIWGTLTLGAHANGFVADTAGRPTHLWIAQRADDKATDPGLFDNLIGGGVPAGQTPWQALQREGWEEAGLSPALMATAVPARLSAELPASALRLHRDVAEGRQLEDLHAFDLMLPQGVLPQNQDGEVAGFQLLLIAEALALATSGRMTVDAALVTLDFGQRHGWLTAEEVAAMSATLFTPAV